MKIVTRDSTKTKKGTFYGNPDKSPSTSLGAIDLVGVGKKASLVSITLDRLNSNRKVDVLAYTYQTPLGLATEFKELETLRDDDVFESEKAMLESYERIIKMREVENISLEKFPLEIKEYFLNDVRTAYKPLIIERTKNTTHCVYICHIYASIVAAVTLMGNIEFKTSIKMKLSKKNGTLKMRLEMKAKCHDIRGREKLKDIQGIEVRLAYIAAICREDNINCTFKLINNSVAVEFDICAVEPHKDIVYSRPDEKRNVFNELMDLFSYSPKDIETEEKEQE